MIVCAATLAAALTCPPIVPPVSLPAGPPDPAPGPVEVADAPASPGTAPVPPGTSATTPTCTASWYGEAHRGLTTASGAPFDPDAFTVAAWDYPFGTVLEVHHEGATVEVTVTDRGPARRLDRCLDLSAAAFEQLAPAGAGLIDVEYREVPDGSH